MTKSNSKSEINPGDDIQVATQGDSVSIRPQLGQRIIDSFKRDPQSFAKDINDSQGQNNLESGPSIAVEPPLQRRLKTRHVQMIALGGSIGMRNQQLKSKSPQYYQFADQF